MVECQYVVSAEIHAEMICRIIKELVDATAAVSGVNTLRHQFKLYAGDFNETCYADPKTFAGDYSYTTSQDLSYFSDV